MASSDRGGAGLRGEAVMGSGDAKEPHGSLAFRVNGSGYGTYPASM